MILILDTDVVSALRRPERVPAMAERMRSLDEGNFHLSAITIGEIERGIARQKTVNPAFAADLRRWFLGLTQRYAARILPFGMDEAVEWGRLTARLGRTDNDLQIAATALARGATVVTRNTADFAPTGCRTLDPFAA